MTIMEIFRFLFPGAKGLGEYQDRAFQFVAAKISLQQLKEVKIGDYVNLWRSNKTNDVVIFAGGGVGGSGYLGVVPSKYSGMIRRHLYECQQTDTSSYYHYKAEVVEINGAQCLISVKLHSEKIRIRMVEEDLRTARTKTLTALEKTYTLRKSVKLKFDLLRKISPSEEVRLRILEKKTYLDDPYNCPIELTSSDGAIIGRTTSQKSDCFRVIRAHYSGQNLHITKRECIGNQLIIEFEGQKEKK